MELGPNMRQLRELDLADTLRACVVAGPGDLMSWDVSATVQHNGLKLDVIGRGTDLEAAAALAIAVLSQANASLSPSEDHRSTLPPDSREVF
jgi:hypothetical protein